MNPVARKTMIILMKVLEMKEFTQMTIVNYAHLKVRALPNLGDISIPPLKGRALPPKFVNEVVKTGRGELTASAAQINRVIRWLVQHGYLVIKRRGGIIDGKPIRAGDVIGGRIYYELINPLGILELIAMHRSMASIKKDTFRVSIKKSELIEFLKSRDVVFCLGTALEQYSGYYRPDEISFYAKEDNKMRDYLKSHPGNLLTVSWYDPPAWVLKNGSYTTEVQTAVDMFCDGKGYYTKDILHKLWGVIVD